jgi:hypothetical protein
MEYATLIRKLGSLHSLLRELDHTHEFQGEHTIAYSSADGVERTLHIYIDGTELQMFDSPPSPGLRLSAQFSSED